MESEEANGSEINYMIAMKHVCKFCHKRFPCGRSLGGHMRSHLITNPEKVNTAIDKKKKSQLIPPPTTTNAVAGDFSGEGKRVMSQDPNQVKACKECGKAFQSSKALSGHMKSHAVEREKEKERERQREKEKENSLLGGGEIEKDPKDQVMDRESDNEGVEVAPKGKSRPRRRTNRRQRYMGATTSATPTTTTNSSCYNNGGSSSVSEIDQQEQEDVAKCLIMLSRDVGPWGGGASGEFSDNNSAFLEPKTGENRGLRVFKWVGESSSSKDLKDEGFVGDEVLSSGYQRFLEKMKSSELGRNLSSKSVLTQSECPNPALSSKRKAKAEPLEVEKRSKFECTTCNKTFHSYQALGGHRASHKKNKGCSPLKPDGSETEETANISVPFDNTQPKAETVEAGLKKSVQIISKHECPICFKEFSSGQALGGHKRSHLMATSAQLQVESTTSKFISVVEKSNATTTVTTTTTTTTTTSSSHEVRDFLDLNLPAPEEEHQQQIVGFKPWWVESTNKHEHLVSLISN